MQAQCWCWVILGCISGLLWCYFWASEHTCLGCCLVWLCHPLLDCEYLIFAFTSSSLALLFTAPSGVEGNDRTDAFKMSIDYCHSFITNLPVGCSSKGCIYKLSSILASKGEELGLPACHGLLQTAAISAIQHNKHSLQMLLCEGYWIIMIDNSDCNVKILYECIQYSGLTSFMTDSPQWDEWYSWIVITECIFLLYCVVSMQIKNFKVLLPEQALLFKNFCYPLLLIGLNGAGGEVKRRKWGAEKLNSVVISVLCPSCHHVLLE